MGIRRWVEWFWELVTEHINRNSNKTSQGCHPEHPLLPLACRSPSVTVLQSPWPLCRFWTCLAYSALTCLLQGPGILPVRLIPQVPKRLALSSLLVLQGEASPTTQSKTAVSPHPGPPSWWFHLWNIWHVTNSAVYWISTTACLLPIRLSVLREHWCLFSVLSAESPGLKQCLALSTRLNKCLLSEWKKMEAGGDDQRSCFQVCLFRTHRGTYCSRRTNRIRVSQMVVSLGHCLPRSSACLPSYRGNSQERKKRHGWKHTSKRNLTHAVTLSFLRNKECNDQDNPCLRPLPPCSPSTKKPEILQLAYHVIGPPEEEVPGLPDSSLLAGENAGHPALECSPFRCWFRITGLLWTQWLGEQLSHHQQQKLGVKGHWLINLLFVNKQLSGHISCC